jgi:hypothetical protein
LSCTEHVASNYPYQINESPIPPQPPQPVDPLPPGPTPPPVVPPEQPGIIIPPPTDPIVPPPAPSDRITLYARPWSAGSVNEQIYRYNTNSPIIRHNYAPYAENGSLFFFPAGSNNLVNQWFTATADSTIRGMQFKVYNGTTELQSFDPAGRIPIYGLYGYGNLAADGTRGYAALIGSTPLYKNYAYRIRAIKYINGEQYEYKLGGDFSWSTWPGSHTYNLNGQIITGTDLEAFWNFLANKYGAISSGSTNLGA